MGKIFRRLRRRSNGEIYEEDSFSIKFYSPMHHRVIVRSGFKKKRAAELEPARIEGGKAEGKAVLPPNGKTLMRDLFEEVVTDYRNNGRKSLQTVQWRIDKHLLPFFEYYRASNVTYSVIEKYKQHRLEQRAKPGTINRELSHLRRALNLGRKGGKVGSVPVFDLLEERNRRMGFFEEKDFLALYVYLPEDIQPVSELAFFTGMRVGEILSLLFNQCNPINCVIRLEDTKNGDAREIHYGKNPVLKTLIEKQYAKREELKKQGIEVSRLFFRYRSAHGCQAGDPIKDFRGAWKKALKAAELEHYTGKNGKKQKRHFHDFRRSAIRNLRRKGIAESTIMLISGHETREVFARYNIRDPKETENALGAVGYDTLQQIQQTDSHPNSHPNAN